MNVSSRTPEGFPSRCPICGADSQIEFSDPGDDAVCPVCGSHLLLAQMIVDRYRRKMAEQLGVPEDQFPAEALTNLGADSLDAVELVMELEEEFDFDLPISEEERINTVRQAIEALLRHRKRPNP